MKIIKSINLGDGVLVGHRSPIKSIYCPATSEYDNRVLEWALTHIYEAPPHHMADIESIKLYVSFDAGAPRFGYLNSIGPVPVSANTRLPGLFAFAAVFSLFGKGLTDVYPELSDIPSEIRFLLEIDYNEPTPIIDLYKLLTNS